MFESILAGLFVIALILLRLAFSRPARRAVEAAIKDQTAANLSSNLELYEQIKAARDRGEEITPPSVFN